MIAFVLKRICWLSYFIPIIIDNQDCILFITKNRKSFADPYEAENYKIIEKLSKLYNFEVKNIKDIKNFKGIVYCVEGDIACSHRDLDNSFKYFNENHYIKCLRADFSMPIIYNIYNKYVDEIIYISKFYCQDLENPKNRFLGSPKYNFINFDKNHIYKKYDLNKNKKYITIFFPKNRNRSNTTYPTKDQMINIYNLCKSLDYELLIKTRKQDIITDKELKDKYYFEEGEHYPNVALELLSISDKALIFSSSVIEECIYMKVPIIEIEIDNINRLPFLKNKQIYNNISINDKKLFEKLEISLNNLNKNDKIFNEIIDNFIVNKYF